MHLLVFYKDYLRSIMLVSYGGFVCVLERNMLDMKSNVKIGKICCIILCLLYSILRSY
jgi:hypothetical protein